MNEPPPGSIADAGLAPLFLLSFRHRDELAGAASRGGWRAIAARRADGAERRFIASGATIAVVDARGALDEGMAAVRSLADAAQANAAALLALISRTDTGSLGAFFEAGATHYLASPFGEAEFAQALRFASRHAERLGGGWEARVTRAALLGADAMSWRMEAGELALSPALAQRLSGGGEAPVKASDLYRALGGDERQAARAAFARLRDGRTSTAFSHALPDGERVAHHISAEDGVTSGMIEPLDAAGPATAPGQRDGLTGLADAAAARRWLGGQLSRGLRPALLLISINRFEIVNTAYGRAAGDALLQAASRRVERVVAELGGRSAIVARMAGAEFLVALPLATLDRARFVAESMVEAIERRFLAGAEMIALGCRVGVVQAGGEEDPVALLRRASAALADAKAAEAGAVRALSPHEEGQAAHHQSLEIDLRNALSQGEIDVLFQPQVSVTSGRIVGVEALARWRHPQHGELGAGTLFAAAERSDYLIQLSEHVQRRAITEAAAWPEALARLRLAVNITAADMARPRFADQFLALADGIGFARDRLTVEVTESGLIEDLKVAADLLADLRAGGCRVAIDDFGTGYSSLAYLKALPLDYLKIDQGLSQDIAGSARDRVVVRGVIEMALSLGLGVIAEGVETEEQLELLAREGCTLYQGFLCAEPVSSGELERLVGGREEP